MTESNKAILLLGSNIEPRLEFLKEAMNQISMVAGEIIDSSKIYESDALGFDSDQRFLNQVIEINTKHKPKELLDHCLIIENKIGRIRDPENKVMSSRKIDIDILYFNDLIIETEDLVIPHPRLHERMFTLVPLEDLSTNIIHPILKVSNSELLKKCGDKSEVRITR